jgi:hypothetical protein
MDAWQFLPSTDELSVGLGSKTTDFVSCVGEIRELEQAVLVAFRTNTRRCLSASDAEREPG